MGSQTIGRGLAAVGVGALSLAVFAPLAVADDCGYTPPSTKQVQHDAVTKRVPREIPGQEAEGYNVSRYKRDIAPVPAETVIEAQYYKVVKGTPKVTETYWQHWRMNPGQRQKLEEQLKRLNPGQEKKTQDFYKMKKWVKEVEEKSHKEYKYEKTESVKQYKYAKESKTVTYKGSAQNVISWLNANSSSHSGDKWVLSDAVMKAAGFDYSHVAHTGNVNLNAYGGPNVSVAYVINPESQITDWVTDTTSPIPGGYLVNTRTVTDTVPYKGGAWTTDTPGSPWKKVDERKVIDQAGVEAHWVYRTKNGTTTDKSKADWFDKEEAGWTTFDTKTETVQDYVAPFEEYKTKNGWSKDKSDADWFPAGKYDDGTVFNTREVQKEIPPFKEWRDGDGNATTDQSKAGWSLKKEIDGWNTGDSEERTIKEATPDVTYYLVMNADGSFTKTIDPAQASWIDVKVKVKDYWKQLGDTRTRETKPAEDGYTEYYVYGGEPTRVLGESNWVKESQIPDAKDGWKFVDEKFHETKAAIPPKTVYNTVVVKKAWIEYIEIPASYTECNDRGVGAKTGGNDGPGATITQADYTGAWVGGGIAAGALTGWAAVAWAKRRKASRV